jgi:hypothetical protein
MTQNNLIFAIHVLIATRDTQEYNKKKGGGSRLFVQTDEIHFCAGCTTNLS